MKKLILILVSLFMMSIPGIANAETYYCYSDKDFYPQTVEQKYPFSANRCETPNEKGYVGFEIPASVYNHLDLVRQDVQKELNSRWSDKKKVLATYLEVKDFIIDINKSQIQNHHKHRIEEVNAANGRIKYQQETERAKKEQLAKRKSDLERVPVLEKEFAKFCKSHTKGSDPYNNCILDQEAKENNRISKMSVDERSAFTCTERFGFRKGSESFKQCVFKLYTAEMDYKKQEQESALRQSEINKLRAEIQSLQLQLANQRSERNVVVLRDSERSLAELNAIEERNRLDRGRFALELADQIRRNSTPARQQLDIPRQPTRCRFGPGGWLNCNN